MLEGAGVKPADRLSFFAADLERDDGWREALDEVIVPAVLRSAREAEVTRRRRRRHRRESGAARNHRLVSSVISRLSPSDHREIGEVESSVAGGRSAAVTPRDGNVWKCR